MSFWCDQGRHHTIGLFGPFGRLMAGPTALWRTGLRPVAVGLMAGHAVGGACCHHPSSVSDPTHNAHERSQARTVSGSDRQWASIGKGSCSSLARDRSSFGVSPIRLEVSQIVIGIPPFRIASVRRASDRLLRRGCSCTPDTYNRVSCHRRPYGSGLPLPPPHLPDAIQPLLCA